MRIASTRSPLKSYTTLQLPEKLNSVALFHDSNWISLLNNTPQCLPSTVCSWNCWGTSQLRPKWISHYNSRVFLHFTPYTHPILQNPHITWAPALRWQSKGNLTLPAKTLNGNNIHFSIIVMLGGNSEIRRVIVQVFTLTHPTPIFSFLLLLQLGDNF